ncbi:MAG TPA: inorganic diphosphatase [Candidatus Angelobacter sp.]
MRIFIENEAGSFVKHHYNEKTLELLGGSKVSRPYPFPYGFVLNTTAADGDNVDCFVLTSQILPTGQIVECEPLGLMEQIEDGEEDHKILAVLQGEQAEIDEKTRKFLTEFVTQVFDHLPGKSIRVGAFHSREAALEYVRRSSR